MSLTVALLTALAAGVGCGAGYAAFAALRSRIDRRARDARRLMRRAADQAEAVLSQQPAVMLLWARDAVDEGLAAAPEIWGEPDALAKVLGAVGVGGGDGANARLLDALAQWRLVRASGEAQGVDGAREDFGSLVTSLLEAGLRFDVHLAGPGDRRIRAQGRAVGGCAAIWLRVEEHDPARAFTTDDGARAAEWMRAAPVPMWRRDFDFVVVWTNAAFNRALLEKEDASPHAFAAHAVSVARAARRQNATVRERIKLSVRGERRAFDIIETPLGPEGFLGFAIDVTEIETLGRRLERVKAARDETFEELESGVAVFGADRRMATANDRFANLFGLRGDHVRRGEEFGVLLDRFRENRTAPEQTDYRAWRARQVALFESADAPDVENWALPDGKIYRVRRRIHRDGGLSFIVDDVTRITELEAAYHTAVRVLGATVDHLADGIAVFGSDGRLNLHNPAFARLWGLGEGFLSTRPHIRAVAEEAARTHEAEVAWSEFVVRATSLAAEDRASSAPRDVTHEDDAVMSAASSPLPDGATLLVFQDVTDTRLRQKTLEERNQALETADRMKSQFVSHVSYQLRTPLNAISGFGEILAQEMFGPLNSRQAEYVQGVIEACGQLVGLVDDMIDLALIEAGRLDLRRTRVDLNALVTEAAGAFEARAEEEEILINVRRDADAPHAPADRARLRQCLDHLLANALAFSDAGGRITLGVSHAEGEIRFWVSDTGRGVSEADQKRVFDRFERRGGRGAGLGLSLVRSFVELHGGLVEFRSALGEGTTVVCRLPLDPLKPLSAMNAHRAGDAYAPIGPDRGLLAGVGAIGRED